MPKSKSAIEHAVPAVPAIRILKIGACPSLSGKSTLTYHIGCTADSQIHCRVYGNDGAGYFNRDWVSLATIQQMLAKVPNAEEVTSFSLSPIFASKSANSAGFLTAILVAERLLQPVPDKRCYRCSDATRFFDEVNALIASEVDLRVPEKDTKIRPRDAAERAAKSAMVAVPGPADHISGHIDIHTTRQSSSTKKVPPKSRANRT